MLYLLTTRQAFSIIDLVIYEMSFAINDFFFLLTNTIGESSLD